MLDAFNGHEIMANVEIVIVYDNEYPECDDFCHQKMRA
jgi:hypothetical protein